MIPQLWTDLTEEELQEERKRIQKDQDVHTGETKGEEDERTW